MTVKNVEKLEKSRVAVTVEVGAEEFEAAVAKAYAKARGKLSIPGFRPGKAPRKMIEKLYGAGVFYSDAVDIALPEAYTQAIGQSGLDVVGYPEIEIVDDKIDENGFTFKATVAVYPEVKLGEYKGLTAEKEEIKVSADDVKERLNEMAERNARLVSVDRKAKKGDIAVIDFEGFDNGEAFEGGKGENYELELGSGSFVPGFEDQVIGMKAGEEKDLDITFPEDYHKDLAGKKVVFHVKAKEIKCKELPKLDDDFAKDVSEYDTLKELKDSIKREITEQREQSAKYAVENELMEKVAANIECDIPDALIDEQCARFLEEFKQRLQSQGIPYDQYCKMTGMDEAKFMEDGRAMAVWRPPTRRSKSSTTTLLRSTAWTSTSSRSILTPCPSARRSSATRPSASSWTARRSKRRRLPRRKPRAKPLKARKSPPRRPLPKSPPRRKKKRLNNRQSGHNR